MVENFTFETFVEGKSNHIALAAAKHVSELPEGAYNPLFIYGGVGLGKTHLMHAVGNKIKTDDPLKKVVYVHSERFVGDMVKSLQLGAINEFKKGKLEYRADKTGIVHLSFGKISFSEEALKENLLALYSSIEKNKPSGVKGRYFNSLNIIIKSFNI